LLLSSSEPLNLIYIETAELDGSVAQHVHVNMDFVCNNCVPEPSSVSLSLSFTERRTWRWNKLWQSQETWAMTSRN